MLSQVLKEEDLLKEIQEEPKTRDSLYKQIAIILAGMGHRVLLHTSYPSIISDIDERKMSWLIAVAAYRNAGAMIWDLSNEDLDFNTMMLQEGLYRHTAIISSFDEESRGYGVPPYYIDSNNQPIGYSRVAVSNPPFYVKDLNPLSSLGDSSGSHDLPPEIRQQIEVLKKGKKSTQPRPRGKPKLVKSDPPESPDSQD